MIKERNHTQYRQGHGFDRGDGIAEVVLDTDIDRCVVHIVLDAGTVHHHEFANTVFSEFEIRTEVHAPAKSVACEVDSVGPIGVNPRDLPENPSESCVPPAPNQTRLPGEVWHVTLWFDPFQLAQIR